MSIASSSTTLSSPTTNALARSTSSTSRRPSPVRRWCSTKRNPGSRRSGAWRTKSSRVASDTDIPRYFFIAPPRISSPKESGGTVPHSTADAKRTCESRTSSLLPSLSPWKSAHKFAGREVAARNERLGTQGEGPSHNRPFSDAARKALEVPLDWAYRRTTREAHFGTRVSAPSERDLTPPRGTWKDFHLSP